MTDWKRVRANLLGIFEVLHWAARGEDLHLIPEEFAQLVDEDQVEILEFLDAAVIAIREYRAGRE